MELHERLERVHRDRAVAVDSAGAPRDVPAHEEVGREVDAARDQLGGEEVEAVRLLRVERGGIGRPPREPAVVVVEAHRVVAGAREALRRAARGVVVGEVRVEAEVDAVEALRDAGPALELEVRAARDDAAVRAGGGVVRDDVREVERGAGLDVRVDGDRNPVGPRLDAVRDEALQRARLRPGERERERAPLAGGERPGAEDEPELVDGRPPAAVVLEQDLRRLGEREGEGLAPPGVADRHRAHLPPEEAGGGGVLAPQRHLGAVERRRAAREARLRQRARDDEAGELHVAVGRHRPLGADRAPLLAVGDVAAERRAGDPDREGGPAGGRRRRTRSARRGRRAAPSRRGRPRRRREGTAWRRRRPGGCVSYPEFYRNNHSPASEKTIPVAYQKMLAFAPAFW